MGVMAKGRGSRGGLASEMAWERKIGRGRGRRGDSDGELDGEGGGR